MAKVADKIMLGTGVISVGGVPLGLTRGGSTYIVERDFREIEADGDRGPVKNRIVIDKEAAKLTVRALELFTAANMSKYYPGVSVDTSASGEDVMTGTLQITAGDYNDVNFIGKTKDGKMITIEVDDAINMDNLEWAFEDKNEVIPELTFTATYSEDARDTAPWRVKFGKGTTYSVAFTVEDGTSTAIVGAEVRFNNMTAITGAGGIADFTGVQIGDNQSFTVIAGGYSTYFGSVNVVSGNVSETVAMAEI